MSRDHQSHVHFLAELCTLHVNGQLIEAEARCRPFVLEEKGENVLTLQRAYLDLLSALVATYYREADRLIEFWSTDDRAAANPFSHVCRGVCLQQKMAAAECGLLAFRRALQLDPRHYHAAIRAGQMFQTYHGDDENAQRMYQSALESHPNMPDAYVCLGMLRIQRQGKPSEGKTLLQRAVEIDQSYAPGHNGIGFICKLENNISAARECCQLALRCNRADSTAHNELGVLALECDKDVTAAEEAYRRAIRCNPSHSVAHINLGSLLWKHRNDPQGGAQEFKIALRWGPANWVAWDHLHSLCLEMKQFDAAEQALFQMVRFSPLFERVAAHTRLGQFLNHIREDSEAAMSEFFAAVSHDPLAHTARIRLAVLMRSNKELVRAEQELREVLKHRSEEHEATAHMWLGMVLHDQRKEQDALRHLEKARDLAPTNPQARFQLAKVLLSRDDSAGARLELRKAVQLDPSHLQARLMLATMLERANPVESEQLYKEVLLQSPKNTEAQQGFQRLRPKTAREPVNWQPDFASSAEL
eukprot:NODE_296_length_1826_cov_246.904333_g238_i0.p1 GENE.NODE_296_length_1826_cov_246.904333_g238_i0~~NODE_296_length_1826_cov_246.904333_g238_i0.p1  ORF type:complete len:530 (-),score=84.14 NODE_296_length_1826_cov_246.904333_g238_i0:121-1710(-)